jgi:hypothetical protein
MTVPASTVHSQSSYGVAGRAAIASGAIGIIAFGLLIAFLVKRILGGTEQICIPIIRAHDVAAILQFVLMVPVVFALNDIATRAANGRGRTPFLIGVVSIALIVLCLALIFIKVVPDDMYMIPLGLFGVWLIGENRNLSSFLPRSLTRLGTVAGVGLVFIGIFPIAFTLFVDRAHLLGWTPFDYQPPPGTDMANGLSHILLIIGTFTGLTTLPIWAALVGRRLLKAS